MRPRVRFLSDELIERILDEAYKLMATKGITLHHDALLARLAEAGCAVDPDSKCVRMPREVVEGAVRTAPSGIELWNIAGESRCDLSGDNVHFTPGSTAIKMLDGETHQMRPVSTDDMLRCGKLVEQLGAIDYSATAVVPDDVPKAIGDSIRLYALLKTTSKAIVTGAFTIEGFDAMAEMHLAVRGTRQALREKTLLTADHTLRFFRREHCIPGPTIDRTQLQDGTSPPPDLMQRARGEVEAHLDRYEPPDVLSAEQLRDLEGVMTAAAGGLKIGF